MAEMRVSGFSLEGLLTKIGFIGRATSEERMVSLTGR